MTGVDLVVVGDVFLDRDVHGTADRVCPDAPALVVEQEDVRERPGGAGLAALMAAADGRCVRLVCALADDEEGALLVGLLAEAGVDVVSVAERRHTPSKTRILADGRCVARLDRPPPVLRAPREADVVTAAVGRPSAVLVADYGQGLAGLGAVRQALVGIARRTPLVWDPHRAGTSPVTGARLVTPNVAEAAAFCGDGRAAGLGAAADQAARLRARWDVTAVAVTRGPEGAVLADGDRMPFVVPAGAVEGGDCCGAGDRLAVTAAECLGSRRSVSGAVVAGVARASAYVADGGVASLGRHPVVDLRDTPGRDPFERAEAVRRSGGTVVATGGCFDLLHTGHLQLLEHARRLGDHLVVCINSDESVRRLKGPDRPIVPERERAALLAGLSCVDDVVVFGERTPEEVLRRLRPDLFVKGGDYATARLPEASVLERWGGRVVTVPYVARRSTTRMVEELERATAR